MGGRGRLEWPGENWSLLLVATHQLQAIVSRPSSAVRWCGRRSVSKLARNRVPQSKDIIKSIKNRHRLGGYFLFLNGSAKRRTVRCHSWGPFELPAHTRGRALHGVEPSKPWMGAAAGKYGEEVVAVPQGGLVFRDRYPVGNAGSPE